jgi:hypothetical protein
MRSPGEFRYNVGTNEANGFVVPKRHRMKHLDFDLILVRDEGLENPNPVCRDHSFIMPPERGSNDPVCRVGSYNICHSVPLLCRLSRSDQLQILDFSRRARSTFRAGWLPASH